MSLSFRDRLLYFGFAPMIVINFVINCLGVFFFSAQIHAESERVAQLLADRLTRSVAAGMAQAVWDLNSDDIERQSSALLNQEEIEMVQVFGEGKSLATAARNGENAIEASDTVLAVRHNIMHGEKRIGELHIGYRRDVLSRLVVQTGATDLTSLIVLLVWPVEIAFRTFRFQVPDFA